jgi:hypothetical protein
MLGVPHLHHPGLDFACMEEPNRAVLILHKFSFYLKNFKIVNLLDIETHLVDLFETKKVLVFLN